MKIALVSPYDFAYPGGVVNHISMLEQYLTRMGHEVKIIAPASQAVAEQENRFIQIGKPRSIPVGGTVARISISVRLAARIKEVLAQEKFDIVHLHEPFMVMLCSAVLRFSNNVNIGTFHASEGWPGYNWGWPVSKYLLRRRARNLDGRIAVSRPAMDYASRFVPAGHYEIIPNGIDLEHFRSDVEPIKEFKDGKLNILFVGRLERRKGLAYLLKAYHLLKEEYPNSRLIVVGPGSRPRRKHEKWVKNHNLKDVVFVGRVSYDDLVRYYKTADIYCAPATGQESFGIVLLEAMAVGTPIVASNIPGYASVMTDGKEGLLALPKNPEDLARALRVLLDDEAMRRQMAERGLKTAARYGWDKVAQQVETYYKKTLKEAPPEKLAMAS